MHNKTLVIKKEYRFQQAVTEVSKPAKNYIVKFSVLKKVSLS